MQIVFEKLPNKSLRGLITEKIREAILNGSLREGERLIERNLANQFETSISSVREALIELESEGFVTKKPNFATYVTKLSPEAAEKIYAVRRVLEGYAVEEAARLSTPGQFQILENNYLAMLDTARQHQTKLFIKQDINFHETIWQMANNEYLEISIRRVVLPIVAFSAMRIMSGSPIDLLQDAYSHLPIIEAIKTNSPESARRAFQEALDEWLNKTRAYIFRNPEGY